MVSCCWIMNEDAEAAGLWWVRKEQTSSMWRRCIFLLWKCGGLALMEDYRIWFQLCRCSPERNFLIYLYSNSSFLCEWMLMPLDLCVTVSIDSIREICEGKQSEIFQRYSEGSFDPNCCFSLYHGEHMESLDLVSGTGEEARTWITGLRYLMAGISDEDSLAKRQRTRDQYPWFCGLFSPVSVLVCVVEQLSFLNRGLHVAETNFHWSR